jgi:hypothetical protein
MNPESKFQHKPSAFAQSNQQEERPHVPENGDPFLLVDTASGENRIPRHLWTRNLPGRRKRDKRHLELLLLLLRPRRRRRGLLLMHDPVDRGAIPSLLLPRGGPPRRGGGGPVGAERGGEDSAAGGRRRRGPGCLRRGVGRRGG